MKVIPQYKVIGIYYYDRVMYVTKNTGKSKDRGY